MRNREAIEHQLSYPDFLALLVQDEVVRVIDIVCDVPALGAIKPWKASI